MNQSFKTNQLLRIVDDAKVNNGKPRIKVIIGGTKSVADGSKPVLVESQKRTQPAEAGRATA